MMLRLFSNVRLFWIGAVSSYVALFRWFNPLSYLSSKIVAPFSQMLFFVLLGIHANGIERASFYVIGNAVQLTAVSGIYGVTMSVSGDRQEGTLIYLLGTPANRFIIFVGRSFLHIFDGMLGVVIALVWGILFFRLDLSQTDPIALALTILVTAFSTASLGLLLGCFGLITRHISFINNTLYFLLLVFSGANIVLSTLPQWMQRISFFLPLTRGIAAARLIVAGETLPKVLSLLIGEFIVGLFYMSLGYFTFHWFEYQGKKQGAIEAF